jgi:hypothetical protein
VAQYRSYDILMQRRELCWMVTMKPTRPELPVFQRYSFQTATQSEREALAQAKRRVDHALEPNRLTYSATSRAEDLTAGEIGNDVGEIKCRGDDGLGTEAVPLLTAQLDDQIASFSSFR